MAGLTTTAGIASSLDAGDLVTAVMRSAIGISNLYQLCTPVEVPNLTGTVPIANATSVTEDVEELEVTEIEGGTFTYIAFDLKKDRVKLAVSDEAAYKSRAGNPLEIQIQDAAQQLAAILDKKVIAALETSPQTSATGGAWSTVTNSPMGDIATALAGISPYRGDFIIMPTAVHAKYLGNNFYGNIVASGNENLMQGAVGKIPGVNLNIFVDAQGYMTEKSVLIGASKYCAAYGRGPVIVNTERNNDLGATIYTLDVFRQVKAPIHLTSASLNKACYQITAAIA